MRGPMFHNRIHEIEDLRRFVASRHPELVVVYGRRGVGKSALVREALGGHSALIYQATSRALPQQMEDMTAALRAFAPDLVLPGVLPDVPAFLDAVAHLARKQQDEPVILVIDELPYLAEADPSLPTVMQRWWDEIRREGIRKLKVFLLGSMVSWMEKQTLSEHGPLHNRRTGQLLLDPLGYREAALFYPWYSPEERVSAYAIWGGMPSYLEEIDPDSGLWDNVVETILRPTARLAEEPAWLRHTDLRSDMVYSSILRAIASGKRRPGDIARAVGKGSANDVTYYLSRLMEGGMIRRSVPIQDEPGGPSGQSLYMLSDYYVAFWYRYVDRLRHLLVLRRLEEALGIIKADFNSYLSGMAFEEVARQFIRTLLPGKLPPGLRYERVGSWWTSRRDGEERDEIDVVALHNGQAVLLGECKWSNQPMDMRDLGGLRGALVRAARDIKPVDHPWRALFSQSGFRDDLVQLARDPGERILLFTPEEMYAS